ncbi:MAG: PQQ-binding-like beta-propeller repeat protein, partial [Rhodospirillaceae bacterium]|nr:PQQ-binding-like beta-propeller repeat protein [Rhodospirillaceae bacterium]
IDAETGSLYVAVTNPAPDFLGEARPGDNLYTNSMVVLDVHTGKLKWYRQMVPHDVHDWDLTQVSPLFSTRIDGQQRKLVATAGKDGMLRVFDRNRRNKVYETAVTKRENVDQPISEEGTHACPGVFGGVQWSAPAYNPNLNALFVPSVEWCGIFTRAQEAIYVKGHLYMGGRYMPDSKWKGWLTAIDASTGTIRWRYESKRPMLAAATTTASDLVFTGELTGDFLALDGQTGAVLFRHNLDGAIAGGIVTYMVEDRQYVAVASGSTTGYWSGPYATAKITLFAVK